MERKYSNKELQDLLQSADKSNNNSGLRYLHISLFDQVRNFIHRNKGGAQDAEDIFQDGLLVIYRMSKQGRLSASIMIEPYLYATCKYLWWKKLKNTDKIITLSEEHYVESDDEWQLHNMIAEEQSEMLNEILMKLTGDCYRILMLFYYNRMRMNKIAQLMHLSNDQVARNKKNQCMKKLREIVFKSKDNFGLRQT